MHVSVWEEKARLYPKEGAPSCGSCTQRQDNLQLSTGQNNPVFFIQNKFSRSDPSTVRLLVCIARSTFEISRHHTINQVKSTFNCTKKAKLWTVTKSGTALICAGLICVHTCITVNGQPKNPPKNCLQAVFTSLLTHPFSPSFCTTDISKCEIFSHHNLRKADK